MRRFITNEIGSSQKNIIFTAEVSNHNWVNGNIQACDSLKAFYITPPLAVPGSDQPEVIVGIFFALSTCQYDLLGMIGN